MGMDCAVAHADFSRESTQQHDQRTASGSSEETGRLHAAAAATAYIPQAGRVWDDATWQTQFAASSDRPVARDTELPASGVFRKSFAMTKKPVGKEALVWDSAGSPLAMVARPETPPYLARSRRGELARVEDDFEGRGSGGSSPLDRRSALCHTPSPVYVAGRGERSLSSAAWHGTQRPLPPALGRRVQFQEKHISHHLEEPDQNRGGVIRFNSHRSQSPLRTEPFIRHSPSPSAASALSPRGQSPAISGAATNHSTLPESLSSGAMARRPSTPRERNKPCLPSDSSVAEVFASSTTVPFVCFLSFLPALWNVHM